MQFNREDALEIIGVSRSIAGKIRGLTVEQVKELYIFLLEQLQLGKSSKQDIINGAKWILPELAPNDRERIALTELCRIMEYKKILSYKRNGPNFLYGWTGPLLYYTSPLDRFLQTGELRSDNYRYVSTFGSASNARKDSPPGYDYEYLRSELPKWKEAGWPLDEFRNVINESYAVFHRHGIEKGEMLTDWLTPACTHTIMARPKMP